MLFNKSCIIYLLNTWFVLPAHAVTLDKSSIKQVSDIKYSTKH